MSQQSYAHARAKCLEAENCLKQAKKKQHNNEKIIAAIDLYTEVLDMNVDIVDPYIGIAYLALSSGDKAKAMGLLMTAKEIDPTDMRVDILMEKVEAHVFSPPKPPPSTPSPTAPKNYKHEKKQHQQKRAQKDAYYQERMESGLKKIEPQPLKKVTQVMLGHALGMPATGHVYEGPEVKLLQEILSRLGLRLNISSHFDKVTMHALKSFQMKHKLSITGWVDDKTRQKLNQYLQKGILNPKKTKPESHTQTASLPSLSTSSYEAPEDIKALQSLLRWCGYTLKLSGQMDVETYQALRKFQVKHKLPMSGELDENTREKLAQKSQQKAKEDEIKERTFTTLSRLAQTESLSLPDNIKSIFGLLFELLLLDLQKPSPLLAAYPVFFLVSENRRFQSVLGMPEHLGALSKGEEVVLLKTLLISKGYGAPHREGEFDMDTFKALKAFQKEQGISETGVTDPLTRTHLNDLLEKQERKERIWLGLESELTSFLSKKGLDSKSQSQVFFEVLYGLFVRDPLALKTFVSLGQLRSTLGPAKRAGCLSQGVEVFLLQSLMRSLRYDVRFTRTYDTATYHAVRKFQMKSKLPMTGVVDQKTRDQLHPKLQKHLQDLLLPLSREPVEV